MPAIADQIANASRSHLIFGPIPQGSIILRLETSQQPPPNQPLTYEPYISSNNSQDDQFSVGSTDEALEVGPACPFFFNDSKVLCFNILAPWEPTYVKVKVGLDLVTNSQVAGVVTYELAAP